MSEGPNPAVKAVKGALICAVMTLASAESNPALARDGCGTSGLMQGGGGVQPMQLGLDVAPFSVTHDGTSNVTGFGELALAYECGNYGVQLDGAFYDRGASINSLVLIGGPDITLSNPQGHLGGAVFWRDPGLGRIGVAGSYILNRTDIDVPGFGHLLDYDSDFTRIGGFGEFYAGDKITLGAGAFYVAGHSTINQPFLPPFDFAAHSGFEGNVSAKYYVNDNISLGLRADLQVDDMDFTVGGGPGVFPLTGYAVTAEAEYLIPDTAISVGLTGRYASRQIDIGALFPFPGASGALSTTDEQVLANVKIALGATSPKSLRDRDIHAPYDNTSVFKEKLPSFFDDVLNGLLTP